MKILINADDLGYTPTINQTIFDLFNRGRLFSSSLLVNMRHSLNAIQKYKSHPGLKVGGHLNLTKGRPLLTPKQIPSLVDNLEEFWPTKQFFARTITGLTNFDEVEFELRTQIEYLSASGIQPTHLDSHSHWHLLPPLRKLITRLAEEYQISGIRQSAPNRTLLPARLWFAITDRKKYPQSDFRMPDYMLSLHQWMGADGQPIPLFFSEQLRRQIAHPDVTVELVVHPGKLHDPDFPPDTLLTHQRQWEVDFLLSARFNEWLDWMNAEIINYEGI